MDKQLWDKLIVALDLSKEKDIKQTVTQLLPRVTKFKVGLIPYTVCGPKIIQWIHNKGAEVFLDLKFFDIPHTMGEAAKLLLEMDVWAFTMHLKVGTEVLKYIKSQLVKESKRRKCQLPLIVGVTELTSHKVPLRKVLKLAGDAHESGIDAVVCSVWESRQIKEKFNLLTITPGIRQKACDDQKRVATVREALQEGVDYFIIGRPIIREKDPRAAAERILKSAAGKKPNLPHT